MTKPGHIRIKPDGVWFEYHELPEPNRLEINYVLLMKKYEASKRTVEVSNVFWGAIAEKWILTGKQWK